MENKATAKEGRNIHSNNAKNWIYPEEHCDQPKRSEMKEIKKIKTEAECRGRLGVIFGENSA